MSGLEGTGICREVSRRLVRVLMRRGCSGTWRDEKESDNHHAVSSLGEAAWRMPLRMICFALYKGFAIMNLLKMIPI